MLIWKFGGNYYASYYGVVLSACYCHRMSVSYYSSYGKAVHGPYDCIVELGEVCTCVLLDWCYLLNVMYVIIVCRHRYRLDRLPPHWDETRLLNYMMTCYKQDRTQD